MDYISIIPSSLDRHLSCFHFLTSWREKQWTLVCWWQVRPFVYMSKSSRAGSRGKSVFNPEKPPHWFSSGCTSLHSHQKWISVPLSPHPQEHVLSFLSFIWAILDGIRWNLQVVTVFVSVVVKDVKPSTLFICSEHIYIQWHTHTCEIKQTNLYKKVETKRKMDWAGNKVLQVKVLVARLTTWVWSSEHTWWKEKLQQVVLWPPGHTPPINK